MWPEILKRLPRYPSAVLSGADEQGYPFSVRCRPQPEAVRERLLLDLAPGLPLRPGPASLLCHYHDAQIWGQRSFLVRGALSQEGAGWAFTPAQYIPGIEQSPQSFLRFLVSSRRKAAAYLKARGLPRPQIPWAKINRVKDEALGRGKR